MRAACLVVLVCACASGDTTPTPPATGRFRIATYNVNFGLVGAPSGVEAIAAARADIVVLQETNDPWERAIVTGVVYRHHRFQGPTGNFAAGGMGVLSKWPILSIDALTSEAGLFFAWRIVIDAPGGPIQVLNVHLHPPMDEGSGSWVIGFFTTRKVRETEAKDHVAKLDPALPTIIAGDFNEEDEGMAIAVFKEHGFADALSRFHPDAVTWQWRVGGTTLHMRLDHVLFDARFRPTDAAVLDLGQSDHAPVVVDFDRL